MISILITVIGLSAFEIINSVDNAVINAEVLEKMSPWGRRWFLLWGILFAVFLVRGLLPWLIIMFTTKLGPIEAFVATFSNNPNVKQSIEHAAPFLLIGAGTFLILLFLHWLFREEKNFGLIGEAFVYRHGIWFYSIASLVLALIVWGADSAWSPVPSIFQKPSISPGIRES